MATQPGLTGFVFRTRRAVKNEQRGFITIARTQVEARETLSRFFHDPWNFELVDKGVEVLREAEGLGIVQGDGKTL